MKLCKETVKIRNKEKDLAQNNISKSAKCKTKCKTFEQNGILDEMMNDVALKVTFFVKEWVGQGKHLCKVSMYFKGRNFRERNFRNFAISCQNRESWTP